MDGGSWHSIGDRDQDHPQEKEIQKSKMAVWGGITIELKYTSKYKLFMKFVSFASLMVFRKGTM